jgi:hypothetical protein
MALKTFNIDEKVYAEFSKHCKKNGISMSRRVENFIKEEMEKLGRVVELKVEAPLPVKIAPHPEVSDRPHPLSKYC